MKSWLTLGALALAAVSSADTSAKQIFDKIKALAGTWEGKAGPQKTPYKVIYRVTGHGSAVIETQFPGMSHEMVTVYHMNGSNLELTHYCAAGNQPRMRMLPAKDAKVVKFDFVDGSNMKLDDMHIHTVTYRFLEPNHIISEWEGYVNGKPSDTEKFDLRRKS